MLVHGNFVARKRAEMMAAAAAGALGGALAPAPASSASSVHSVAFPAHARQPAAVFGAAADEMVLPCGCARARMHHACALRCAALRCVARAAGLSHHRPPLRADATPLRFAPPGP